MAPEGHGRSEASALLGQAAAQKGGLPSPKKGGGAASCGHGGEAEGGQDVEEGRGRPVQSTTSAWLEG